MKLEEQALAYARLRTFGVVVNEKGITRVDKETYMKTYEFALQEAAVNLLIELSSQPLPEA